MARSRRCSRSCAGLKLVSTANVSPTDCRCVRVSRAYVTAVLVVNVLNYWKPLRELVRNGIENGFILAKNEALLRFVEGPADLAEHESFDWGKATMEALDKWQGAQASHFYDWTLRKDGKTEEDVLGAV